MKTTGKLAGNTAMALACAAAMLCTGILLGGSPPAPPATAPSPGHHPMLHGMPATHPASAPATARATATATRTAEQKKQDDIERVMAFFLRTQPDVYDQALTLRSTDPAKFDKLIVNALPTVDQLEEIRKTKPELFELSMKDLELGYQSLRLAHELKRTDLSPTDRAQLTAQLKMTITSEFDVQQKIRRQEIDALQAKVKDLGDQVEARDAGRDAIIQKRTDDLTQGVPRLEW